MAAAVRHWAAIALAIFLATWFVYMIAALQGAACRELGGVQRCTPGIAAPECQCVEP